MRVEDLRPPLSLAYQAPRATVEIIVYKDIVPQGGGKSQIWDLFTRVMVFASLITEIL